MSQPASPTCLPIARVEPLTQTRAVRGPFDYRLRERPARGRGRARCCASRSGTARRSGWSSSWRGESELDAGAARGARGGARGRRPGRPGRARDVAGRRDLLDAGAGARADARAGLDDGRQAPRGAGRARSPSGGGRRWAASEQLTGPQRCGARAAARRRRHGRGDARHPAAATARAPRARDDRAPAPAPAACEPRRSSAGAAAGGADRRPAARARAGARRARAARARPFPAPRRDRLREDRGLPARGRGGAPGRRGPRSCWCRRSGSRPRRSPASSSGSATSSRCSTRRSRAASATTSGSGCARARRASASGRARRCSPRSRTSD